MKYRWLMRFPLVTAFAVSFGAATSLAHATPSNPNTSAPAYRLDAALDVPIVLLGAAATSSFIFLDEARPVACGVTCNRAHVNGFDRWAAGRYSPAWSNVGDVATAATMLFAPLVIVLEEGWRDGLNDSLVIGEAALLSSALQVSLSYAAARPRPRVYGSDAPIEERTDANAARSFFSGHTANVVAATVAATITLHRLGRSAQGWLVLGAGLAGSTVVGAARILAGGHFPSDVLVGAAVGAGFGILVPHLHSSNVRVAPMTGAGIGGINVSGAW